MFVWWGFAKGSRGAIWSQVDRGILVSFFIFLVLRRGWTKRHWKEGNRSAQKILRINLPQKSRSRFFFLGFCFALCCFAKTLSFVKLLLSVEREREGEKRKKKRERDRERERETEKRVCVNGRRRWTAEEEDDEEEDVHCQRPLLVTKKNKTNTLSHTSKPRQKKTHACFIKI